MKTLLSAAILLTLSTASFGDASVDLGGGKTRFDLAAEWCTQFNHDPRLTYYVIDNTRVVFSQNCSLAKRSNNDS